MRERTVNIKEGEKTAIKMEGKSVRKTDKEEKIKNVRE